MEYNELNIYADRYKTEHLDSIIPFCINHSKDDAFGGYFTPLNRHGKVLDANGFIWIKERKVCFLQCFIINKGAKNLEWLDIASLWYLINKKNTEWIYGNICIFHSPVLESLWFSLKYFLWLFYINSIHKILESKIT